MLVRVVIAVIAVLQLFFLSSCVVDGFGSNFWRIKTIVREQRKRQALKHIQKQRLTSLPGSLLPPNVITDQYLVQPLDHFDSQNKGTYSQRYWVNTEHWKPPTGPVFLYIGGEGPLNSLAAQYGAYVEYAKIYGALIFAVEHRFYGESINDDGLKLQNLRYLSSQQALADLAHFHQVLSKSYNLTRSNRWIAFGGSYPGSLAAWIRIKYPHLIFASVASSAPVEAVVDFTGYNDVVARSLGQPAVGGSDQCVATVSNAFGAVDSMIKQGKHRQLVQDFHSCGPIVTELDVYQFVSNLADVFMGTVQYNNEMSGLNVSGLCTAMTRNASAYDNLVHFYKGYLELSGANCTDNSWQNFIKQMMNVTVDRGAEPSTRQWIHQTCNQFGYYQTCEPNTSCPFSHYMSLQPSFELCRAVFDITSTQVYDQVDFTNEYYGSNDPQGSRILFVNGLIDPWHALSVLNNVTSSELAVIIPETAHCADMESDKDSDPPSLRAARKKISDQIGLWINTEGSNATPKSQKRFKTFNDVLKIQRQ